MFNLLNKFCSRYERKHVFKIELEIFFFTRFVFEKRVNQNSIILNEHISVYFLVEYFILLFNCQTNLIINI